MQTGEWLPQFEANYSVLKNLAGKVPQSLLPIYNRLMANAAQIEQWSNAEIGLYPDSFNYAIGTQQSDAINNWFGLVHRFAQKIGTLMNAPVPNMPDMDVTPPVTAPIYDAASNAGDYITHDLPQGAGEFVGLVEALGIGLAILMLLPPIIRALRE